MFLCRVTQYKRNEYIYLSNSPEAIFLGEKQVADCSIASFYKKETDLIVGDDSRKRKNDGERCESARMIHGVQPIRLRAFGQ